MPAVYLGGMHQQLVEPPADVGFGFRPQPTAVLSNCTAEL
jgi:hypothetical protein